MLVREWMTPDPVTVHSTTSFYEAFQQLRKHKLHRLPVVDHEGRLVGIASEYDFLHAAPSTASALKYFELDYQTHRFPVSRVMTRTVITIQEDCAIQQAASLMEAKKIGALPVVRGDRLVGIITRTDILRMIAKSLGGNKPGLLIYLRAREGESLLASITGEISRLNGKIDHFFSYQDQEPGYLRIAMKLQDVTAEEITRLVSSIPGAEILSVRDWQSDDCASTGSEANLINRLSRLIKG